MFHGRNHRSRSVGLVAVARYCNLAGFGAVLLSRDLESGRVPMHRANIASAEALIDEVTRRLHAPEPVSTRGMARLRQLLSTGTSPLYRHGRGDLAGRLSAALAAL